VISRFVTKEGKIIWGESLTIPVYDRKGKITAFEWVAWEITERIKQEKELTKAQKELARIFENYEGIIYLADSENPEILTFFGNMKGICGYSVEEFEKYHLNWKKPIHPDDLIVWESEQKKTVENPGYSANFKYRIRHRNGSWRWVNEVTSLVSQPEGIKARYFIQGSIRDITQTEKYEEKLRESEALFRSLAETAASAIFIYQDEKFPYVNPACEKLTGYSREELAQMNFRDLVHPDFHPILKTNELAKQKKEKLPARFQFKLIRKNQETRWVDFTSSSVKYQGKPAVIGTAYDITEIVEYREKLREAAREWRATFDTIEDPVCVIDLNSRILRCNQALAKLLKKDLKELLGKNLCALVHGKQGELTNCPFAKTKKTRQREACTSQIGQTWFYITTDPVLDSKGKLKGAVHLMKNITRLVQAEIEARKKEEFLESVFDSVQDGISVLDNKLNILMTNQVIEEWYSYSLPLKGKKCFEAYHKANKPCHPCPSLQALKSGQPAFEVVPKRDAKGEIIGWLDLFSFPLINRENGKIDGVVEYVRDITARVTAEESLKKTNQLLALLLKVNKAISQATEETKLLREVANLIVKVGGYTLAWIGQPEENKIKLIAKAGTDKGLLKTILNWIDNKELPCLTIKKRKPFVINNLKKEAKEHPWRENALKAGFFSMAILPLTAEESLQGVLAIYSDKPDAFQKKDLETIKELAEDLSFGITALRAQAEKEKARKKLIETLKKLRQEEKRAQELTQKIIEAQEKERLYLASEIHDQLLQSLVATYYFLEAIDFSAFPKQVQKQKEDLSKILQSSIKQGRALLRKIEPLREEDITLEKAIEETLELDFAGTKTLTHFHFAKSPLPFNREEKINLLRLIQEALMNVRKYAEARNVWVKFSLSKNQLEVEIKDDGRGFELEKISQSSEGHFGLLTMKERARILKGKLLVQSKPGEGTTIKAIFPLRQTS